MQPGFEDAAFEPHAGYMFDETSGMDQFHRDFEASYNGNIGIEHGDAQALVPMTWEYVSCCSDQASMTDQASPTRDRMNVPSSGAQQSLQSASWQAVDSNNLRPYNGDNGSGVSQRFGQVTPVTSQSRSPASLADDTQQHRQQQQQIAQSNAKSERARNAANHRHSQTKQARELLRMGIKSSTGRSDGDDEDKPRGLGKTEYREKNRQAAAKCRRKKKDSTEILESTARSAVEENTRLKTMVRQLRDQYSDLRTKALAHDGPDSCGCTDIHQYNADQAHQ